MTLLGDWSSGSAPLYQQLAQAITDLVVSGALRAGHQLPPERGVAAALNVSRGTVVRAYDDLAAAGVLSRVQGSGTTVRGHEFGQPESPDFVGDRIWSRVADQTIDLLKAIPPALDETLDLVAATDLRVLGDDINSTEPLGVWPLRARIAEWYQAQGLPTTPHQIMITSGAQQALMIAVHALVRPGDVVLAEEDTWPGLIDIVRQHGARFQKIRMDNDGIVVDELEMHLQRYTPALIVLNPQMQNPTGTCLAPERVERVAQLVRQYRVPVVEDRIAAALSFDGRYRAPIAAHETDGQALIVDSLDKIAWSGTRGGWIRADAQLIQRLRSTKAINDMYTSLLSQAVTLTLLDHYDALVAARRAQLRRQADVVVDALRREVPDWSFNPPRGGLSVWAKAPEGTPVEVFVQHAAHHGVQLASCQTFYFADAGVGGTHIRVPFAAPEPILVEGIRRLGEAWRSFDPNANPTVNPIAASAAPSGY